MNKSIHKIFISLIIAHIFVNIPTRASSSHLELNINPDDAANAVIRGKRQGVAPCDFGIEPSLVTCEWTNRNGTVSKWELGAGILSNWIGGPSRDANVGEDAQRGGFIFFETSLLSVLSLRLDEIFLRDSQTAFLESPILKSSGASGKCISFSYSIDGLSAAGLRVMLQPVNQDGRVEGFARELWSTRDSTNKAWQEAQTLYTYNKDHKIVFEGIAKDFGDLFRKFRGFVAVDNLALKDGLECKGHCSFEGGFCGWTNDEDDDFNWSLGRGSRNPSTGPPTDRSSYIHGGIEGGYAYIDTSYPRRPGDVAKLSSLEFDFTGPDSPMCMKFYTHMFGNGIGSLTVSISDTRNNQQRDVWNLNGETGNAWSEAEVPVSSPNPFKVVLTAKVGNNDLGDIAVDDISLTHGACPTAPESAAPNSRDCTFEVELCGWSNVGSRERMDDIDWERISGAAALIHDHTSVSDKGYMMVLAKAPLGLQRPGSRAWFTSRDFRLTQPVVASTNAGPRCFSFWFIMNEPFINATIGPSLGALTIYTRSNERDSNGNFIMKPIWRLYNHQGPSWMYAQAMITNPNDTVIVEGIWGSSRLSGFIAIDDIAFFSGPCTTLPRGAKVRPGECRFDRDTCEWTNLTDKSMASWRLATVPRRPGSLPDKTFGAPDGYVYYDLFNQILGANMVKLISPLITAGEDQQLCFSFWYVAFGAGESAVLQISKLDNASADGPSEKLWSLEARNVDTARPMWLPAQFTVDGSRDFHIVMEGQATNGGFGVDDIIITPGNCPTRPEKAIVRKPT